MDDGALEKVFSRRTRLRCKADFDYMRNDGKKYAGRYCVVVVAAPKEPRQRKISVANSRRFSTKAVERNRARRLLKEAYRLVYQRLLPVWMILIPRQSIKKASFDNVQDELEELFRRAGIMGEC